MKPILFTRGVPPPESIPVQLLANCAKEAILDEGANILQYSSAAGYLPLRERIAQWKGISPNRIILGQGSLQILDIIFRCLMEAGDTVAIEQPGYDRVLTLMRRSGFHIIPLDLENDGLDLEELEQNLKDGKAVRLLYAIPDFQNPSGSLMSLEKRRWLVSLAAQYDFYIVEDSPYRPLRYTGEDMPSLWELAPDRTIQLSSFSKLISPGLRVGYGILPEPMIKSVIQYAEDTYINPSYLNHAIVYYFIKNGFIDEHVRFLKDLYSKRLKALLSALDNNFKGRGKWSNPQGGFFVGLWLNINAGPTLLEKAREKGIQLTDGRGFFVNGGENFVRLPFCALNEEEIQQGIVILSRLSKSLHSLDSKKAMMGEA